MPFVISSANKEYQRRQSEILEEVQIISDGNLIWGAGETREEVKKDDDEDFRGLMQSCRERKLKINKDNLKLNFVRHIISDHGLKPDEKKSKSCS